MKARTTYTFLILGIFLMLNGEKANAQQLPDFSFSKESMFLYNPSVAGHAQGMYIFSTFRSQWGKIEGSPFTANIGFHTPLRNKRINLGASVFNDFTGPTSYSGISGSFPTESYSTKDFLVKGQEKHYPSVLVLEPIVTDSMQVCYS